MSIREMIQAELEVNPEVKGRELADKFKCAESYVSNIRNGKHRKLYRRGSYLSKTKKEWIRDLWNRDVCATGISRATNVPLNLIIKFLQTEGLT